MEEAWQGCRRPQHKCTFAQIQMGRFARTSNILKDPWTHQIIKYFCGSCLVFSQDVLCLCCALSKRQQVSQWLLSLGHKVFPHCPAWQAAKEAQNTLARSWECAAGEERESLLRGVGSIALPGPVWHCYLLRGLQIILDSRRALRWET